MGFFASVGSGVRVTLVLWSGWMREVYPQPQISPSEIPCLDPNPEALNMRIVCLERASIPAPLPRPDVDHEWLEFESTQQDQVVGRLSGARIAIVNKLRIGAAELAALQDLQMISLLATGADNIDLAACAARGIVVSNVRGYAVHSVPEHAILLMLALRRSLFDYVADVRGGRWARAPSFCLTGHPVRDLNGATLGIIGRGALGAATANLGAAFGMRILFAERKGADLVREGYASFEQVLGEADVLSLHCPLGPATRGLIGAAELARMKPEAILVNTARGALVDEQALADALRAGRIAGAAVDVLSQEPPREGNPLLAADVPNLLVTPHIAWGSSGAMRELAAQAIRNVEAFVAGTPRNRLA